ncbi:hypothetical protein N008_01220 [Hymenobacter sp. APR13]|nr:hypothetical protein N008_01220 [Hymenobacter sp. APR13]
MAARLYFAAAEAACTIREERSAGQQRILIMY